MTVLIDTSVWLRFLRGEEAGLVAQSWITSGQALVHPFVVGELLLGGLSAENEALLRSQPRSAPPSPEELYDFIRRHQLAGTGIGWGGRGPARRRPAASAQLATFDTPLARCARQLDVATPVPLPKSDQ